MRERMLSLPLVAALLAALTVGLSLGGMHPAVALTVSVVVLTLGFRPAPSAAVGVLVTSCERRAQVWRGAGMRLHDPSRPGRVRPRAPGLVLPRVAA